MVVIGRFVKGCLHIFVFRLGGAGHSTCSVVADIVVLEVGEEQPAVKISVRDMADHDLIDGSVGKATFMQIITVGIGELGMIVCSTIAEVLDGIVPFSGGVVYL